MEYAFILLRHYDTGYDHVNTDVKKVYFNAESALDFFNIKDTEYFYSLQVWSNEKDFELDDFSPTEREKSKFCKKYLTK